MSILRNYKWLLLIVVAMSLTAAIIVVNNNTKQTEIKLQQQVNQLEKRSKDQQDQQVKDFQKKIDDLNARLQSKASEKARLAAVEASKTSLQQKVVQSIVPTAQAAGSLSGWLLTLRLCESGGNYQTNTGNGYYGAYQFSIATWNHWNTGYARADLAPAAVQDATIVLNTNASQGLVTQNPGCYAKGNLSNKPPQ